MSTKFTSENSNMLKIMIKNVFCAYLLIDSSVMKHDTLLDDNEFVYGQKIITYLSI